MSDLYQFKTVWAYQQWRNNLPTNQSVGFVPTMGALHAGHLELVRRSLRDCDLTVISIFVNPKQFNNPDDFKHYPITLENDLSVLSDLGCDIAFIPSNNEVYPDEFTDKIDLAGLDLNMEGAHRPGHFQGVAVVVKRLFEIIRPSHAYFGEKDFQQLAIIKHMTNNFKFPVKIIPCETIRASSGLALSSRNMRLTEQQLAEASKISKGLFSLNDLMTKTTLLQAVAEVVDVIDASKYMQVEYLEVIDAETLRPCKDWDDSLNKRACIAVQCGAVRLIDNVKINS